MNFNKIFEERNEFDNNLSNRHINLDPKGYFIIKLNIEFVQITVEHYLNKINEEGYALDPHTNEPIKCDSKKNSSYNEIFTGRTAKEIAILITEKRNDLISRFDHAMYLGRELQKAEECLYKKLPYIQD